MDLAARSDPPRRAANTRARRDNGRVGCRTAQRAVRRGGRLRPGRARGTQFALSVDQPETGPPAYWCGIIWRSMVF
jgi:hypothetical protein